MFFKTISQSLQRIEELLLHFTARQESIDARARSLDLSLSSCSRKVKVHISSHPVIIDDSSYDFHLYQGCNSELFCLLPAPDGCASLINYYSAFPDDCTIEQFGSSFMFSLEQEYGKDELLSKAILYFVKWLDARPNGLNR